MFLLRQSGSSCITVLVTANHQSPPLEDRPRVGCSLSSSKKKFLFVPVKICRQTEVSDFQALIDSRAKQSLIDHSLDTRLSLPVKPLDTPIKAAG